MNFSDNLKDNAAGLARFVDRWERLFLDLETEVGEAEAAELAAEIADRTRLENARLRLIDRLHASKGNRITVLVPTAGRVCGQVSDVGPDWLLLGESTPGDATSCMQSAVRHTLIPIGKIGLISGMGAHSTVPNGEGVVASKLDMRFLLRKAARSRVPLVFSLTGSEQLSGTIDRVGKDFVEIATHPTGEPRRRHAVTAVCDVPLTAVELVRSLEERRMY